MTTVSRQTPAQRTRQIEAQSTGQLPHLVRLYKQLHSHPELSGHEDATSTAVSQRLEAAGYQVTEHVGETGVVGVLRNGPGKTVMLRGDMDALPIAEQTGLPYASTRTTDDTSTPVMHACAHDVHTAALVGAARLLASAQEQWSGTVVICAQPAEETLHGAKAMLADGLFTRFPRPDVCLGQHAGAYRHGTVLHREGPMMSASATLKLTIHGRGGHASQPERCIDPVLAGAYTLTRIQSILGREVPAGQPVVLSATTFHAGGKENIIPDHATIGLDLRTRDDAHLWKVREAIERIATAECAASNCPQPPSLQTTEACPALVNDPVTTRIVRRTHHELEGDSVTECALLNSSEDFAEYRLPGPDRYPGPPIPCTFWWFGITDPTTWDKAAGNTLNIPGIHTPGFAPRDPEPTLRLATRLLLSGALSFL